jgi:hypothetical protein
MLHFQKIKRKPTYVDMAKVSFKEINELLKSGIDGKSISISKEDLELIKDNFSDDIAGFIATDGDAFWFINYEFAKKIMK